MRRGCANTLPICCPWTLRRSPTFRLAAALDDPFLFRSRSADGKAKKPKSVAKDKASESQDLREDGDKHQTTSRARASIQSVNEKPVRSRVFADSVGKCRLQIPIESVADPHG